MDPEQLHKLISLAFKTRDKAYAPYSQFRVGAALLTSSGAMIGGCNIENASYPAGICAERCALCKAISEGETRIEAVVVVSDVPGPEVSPCGICRQMLREFTSLDAPVYMVGAGYASAFPADAGAPAWIVPGDASTGGFPVAQDTQLVATMTLGQLLPMSFGPDHLLMKRTTS